MFRNRFFFIIFIFSISGLMEGCSTTTVHLQTGSSSGAGDEARFFVPLSRKDGAYDLQEESPRSRPAVAERGVHPVNPCACPPSAAPVQSPPPAQTAQLTPPAKEEPQPDPAEEEANQGEPDLSGQPTPEEESYFSSLQGQGGSSEEENPEADRLQAAFAGNGDDSPSGNEGAKPSGDYQQIGTASWYGRDFDGRKTASGEVFDSRKLTGAHKNIPLGSIVLVRNLENDKEVLVKVNDRGPYVKGRVIDLSEYAAEMLGYKHQGLTTVGIKVVRRGDGKATGPGVTEDFYREQANQVAAAGESPSGDTKPLSSSYISAALSGSEESSPGASRYERNPVNPASIDVSKEKLTPEGSLKSYSVQVGVFEDMANAVNMKRYLTTYGQPIHIVQRGALFVVKVGEFASRYGAEQLKYQLVADGYGGFVTEPSR